MQSDQSESEEFSVVENLLNYIPYDKLMDLGDSEHLQVFLVYIAGKNTLVPELAKVLPPKLLLELLFVFAGQDIQVPDKKFMSTAFRDIDIYFSLVKTPSFVEIGRLATKYNTSVQVVRAVSERVAESLGKDPPVK